MDKDNINISIEEIDNLITAAGKTLDKPGRKFKFRKGQFEAIRKVIQCYQDGYNNVVIDAPTGTGKSIIAMIVSKVLNKLGKSGYIVTSDLGLQNQYEEDFKYFKTGFGSVRGIDNYKCSLNGEIHSLGLCRSAGIKGKAKAELHCYNTCPYFVARNYAIEADTSLLNYSFHLLQQNYVNRENNGANGKGPFTKRDFIIFDEAHKIDTIVQNHFAPVISMASIELLNDFRKISTEANNDCNYYIPILENLMKEILNEDNTDMYVFYKLKEFFDEYSAFSFHSVIYKEQILKLFQIKGGIKRGIENYKPNYEQNKIIKSIDRHADICCKLEDYINDIEKTTIRNVVRTYGESETGKTITFKNIDESNLIRRTLLFKSKFKVYMSATFGEHRTYSNLIGMYGKTKVIRLDNNFDFKKSPIYVSSKFDMSFKMKENFIIPQIKFIDNLLSYHDNERGIIHTVSYQFTQELLKNIKKNKKRLITYKNSKEKEEALEKFKKTKGAVIIGPSMIEGVDLKDDLSRFQIFMKVPFPSLGDEFIKRKMKLHSDWYNWKTMINIQQGIGRSIRNENDYAVTYCLDKSFVRMFNSSELPKSFKERIIYSN